MLVLSRRLGQELIIGENIVIRVIQIKRGIVRIGIEAPRSVPVVRREIVSKDRSVSTNPIKE